MTISIEQLLNLKPVMQKISTLSLPMAVTYKVIKLIKALDQEYQVYQTCFQNLMKSYCELDEEGNPIPLPSGDFKIKAGCEEQCQNDYLNLLAMQIDVPDIRFKLADFDKLNITANELWALMPFLEDADE